MLGAPRGAAAAAQTIKALVGDEAVTVQRACGKGVFWVRVVDTGTAATTAVARCMRQLCAKMWQGL